MCSQATRAAAGRAYLLLAGLTGVLAAAAVGGCPGSGGLMPNLFSGGTLIPLLTGGSGTGEAGGTSSGPAETEIQPDAAEAAAVLQQTPGTVAFAETDAGRIATVIDEQGGLHEFVVLADEQGEQYPAEYRYEGDRGRLHVTADPDGQIETIDVYDPESGSWIQLALQWSDPTHALANLTSSENDTVTGQQIELEQPLTSAKAAHARARRRLAAAKTDLRSQPTAEQQLSLPVKIKYVDQQGLPVSDLRATFRLRALDRSATFGVARGDQLGLAGEYLALIPAYRYRRVAGDYPEWKPTMEWAVYTVTSVSLLLAALPLSPAAAATLAVSQTFGLTFLPAIVDRVMAGEYSDAPYPTALGQNVEYFQVWVSCNDRRHTTVLSGAISYDELYEDYVEPRQFLDLGTVTVEPVFEQPAPGYRLYQVRQIGSGQIEVLPEGSENQDIPLCQFEGGGLDCTIMAELQPISAVYPTKEQAVQTICDQVYEIQILPLGVGPAARFGNSSGDLSDWTFLSYEVYGILLDCPG